MSERIMSRALTLSSLTLVLCVACGNQSFAADDADSGVAGEAGVSAQGNAHDDSGVLTPSVLSTTPLSGGAGIAVDESVSATFSEAMTKSSISTATFTLMSADAPVAGSVVYADATATFFPTAHLAADTVFVATIGRAATAVSGATLTNDYSWSFTTGAAEATIAPVNLGSAGTYAILSKAGIFTAPASSILGDIGVSPAAATYITGFSLTADASNMFSTSTQVTGKVYAADYLAPTPANLTSAVGDSDTAFSDAATRTPKFSESNAGLIGGATLVPGVYHWTTDVSVLTDLTLQGSATDVWIFQTTQSLSVGSGVNVLLSGGSIAKNVFWQVDGTVNLGTNANFTGIVLAEEAVTLQSGASIRGRILGKTSVSLAGNTVAQPAP
jgi:hypothetical protein